MTWVDGFICHNDSECQSYGILWGTLAAVVALSLLLWRASWPEREEVRPSKTMRDASQGEYLTSHLLGGGEPASLAAADEPWASAWASARPSPPAALSWERVSYRVSGVGTPILQPSMGALSPGLWAMIGPSGAGKSSLLAILAGRKATGRVGGVVKLDGEPASREELHAAVGYVTQEDILPGTSTVAEHLHFHARLRLPWLGKAARAAIVRRALPSPRVSTVAPERCILACAPSPARRLPRALADQRGGLRSQGCSRRCSSARERTTGSETSMCAGCRAASGGACRSAAS